MATLEAALDYARLGWRVVPILAGSKRPALTRWTEHASTDEAVPLPLFTTPMLYSIVSPGEPPGGRSAFWGGR